MTFERPRPYGVHYLVSGAGGKLRSEPATDFEGAGTRAWASEGHFLLVEVDERQVVVHPVRDAADSRAPVPVALRDPTGRPVETPIEIRR